MRKGGDGASIVAYSPRSAPLPLCPQSPSTPAWPLVASTTDYHCPPEAPAPRHPTCKCDAWWRGAREMWHVSDIDKSECLPLRHPAQEISVDDIRSYQSPTARSLVPSFFAHLSDPSSFSLPRLLSRPHLWPHALAQHPSMLYPSRVCVQQHIQQCSRGACNFR